MDPATGKVKGLVLAAGFGTRLRPLTDVWPKPLIPFLGSNPLALAIDQLRSAGINDIAVNTHYLAQVVEDYLQVFVKQKIRVSREDNILGTGGAYNPLRSWIGDAHLAVINGDIVSDINVKKVLEEHMTSGAIATMALLPQVIQGESGVHYSDGFVTGIGRYGNTGAQSGNFACVQILSPRFFEFLPTSGSFDIISTAYAALLREKLPIKAALYDGIWHDIRSPQFYFDALCDVVGRRLHRSSFISPTASIGRDAQIGDRVFVEGGASVFEGAVLQDCVLLPGAFVEEGILVKKKIIGHNFSVDLA
jgi:NDP-sugar pyrophosphorylase family protein